MKNLSYDAPLLHGLGSTKCALKMLIRRLTDKQVSERKLVIMFCGNGMIASDSVKQMHHTTKIKNDFLAVGWPDYATSSQELVDAGVIAILKAINAGYNQKNITITGHSLGGAVSALVLREIKEKYPEALKGQKFAGYVNHRSFTNLGAVTTPFLNKVAYVLGLQLNADQAIAKGLPVKQMKFYCDDGDGVIRKEASMALWIKDQDVKVPIAVKVTNVYDHNGPMSNSMFKTSKQHSEWSDEKDKNKATKYIETSRKYPGRLETIME